MGAKMLLRQVTTRPGICEVYHKLKSPKMSVAYAIILLNKQTKGNECQNSQIGNPIHSPLMA